MFEKKEHSNQANSIKEKKQYAAGKEAYERDADISAYAFGGKQAAASHPKELPRHKHRLLQANRKVHGVQGI